MKEKCWKIAPLPQEAQEKAIVDKLVEEVKIPQVLGTLLWQRGVTDFEAARTFFRPQLEHLHDPFLMADMHKAVERLEKALSTGERIVIYGDYDVDGTTAVALVYGFLSKRYDKLEHYNPDRYLEGYGVSKQGIDWAHEQGATLMISLDCGIKSADKIRYAKETYGIDFIVCDHHEPDEKLPEAVAVLDPKRKDCGYPFKELTGNGVGFKLLQAYCLRNDIPLEELYSYLDLAAISVASDIVPIVGENRVLTHFGLELLNANPRPGIRALKEVAGFTTHMTVENMVFVIGPRINAAGRIKHARAAVQLLLCEDYDEAMTFAKEIQDHNTERRGHDSRITEEALAMIEADNWLLTKAKSTVLFKPDWHKGVIGIVASRCIEKYYRPTIILTESKGMAAGSARSVEGFDLYSAIESCSHLLEQFGGHTHAAGMTLPIENVAAFQKAFDEVVCQRLRPEQEIPTVRIDLEMKLGDISGKFYRIIRQMAPFGPQNMQPVFMSKQLCVAKPPQILKEKHLKIELLEEETGVTITALGFGMVDEFYRKLMQQKYFSAVYTLEENNFRGNVSLQAYLRDMKFE